MKSLLKIDRRLVFWSLLAIAFCYAYGRAVTMGYVLWDDDVMIQHNAMLQLPFAAALKVAFGGMYHGDYMPLTLISYWSEIALVGMNPQLQHLVNLLLHLVNVLLLYRLMRNFPEILPLAPVLITLYALHPVQVESVVWISERKGLLAASLYLGALICATSTVPQGRSSRLLQQMGYVSLFTLATLAKTNGIFLPLWLMVLQRLRDKATLKQLLANHGSALLVCALIAVIRFCAYAKAIPDVNITIFAPDRLIRLPLIILAALGFYLRTLFYPRCLALIYPTQIEFDQWMAEIFMGGLFLALFFFHLVFYQKRRDSVWFILFPLMALFTLAPVLQIVPRVNFVNDRYLYLPIIGFGGYALLLMTTYGGRLCRSEAPLLRRPRRLLPLLWLPLLALLAIKAHERTAVWQSNVTLWSDTAAKTPLSGIAHNNLGLALQEQGDIAASIHEFEEGIHYGERDGTMSDACNSLAVIYSTRPKFPQYFNPSRAIALLREGIAKAPQIDETYVLRFNLALDLWLTGAPGEAIDTLAALQGQLAATANHRFDYLNEEVAKLARAIHAQKP